MSHKPCICVGFPPLIDDCCAAVEAIHHLDSWYRLWVFCSYRLFRSNPEEFPLIQLVPLGLCGASQPPNQLLSAAARHLRHVFGGAWPLVTMAQAQFKPRLLGPQCGNQRAQLTYQCDLYVTFHKVRRVFARKGFSEALLLANSSKLYINQDYLRMDRSRHERYLLDFRRWKFQMRAGV